MVTEFETALGLVTPFYNLILAVIILFLFMKFFRMPNRLVYMKPWKIIFAAFCIYLIEETFTVIRNLGLLDFPTIMNGIFEMIIISLFIYALLLQKEYLKKVEPEEKPAAKAVKKSVPKKKQAKAGKKQSNKGKKR